MTYVLHLSSPFGPRGAGHCYHNCSVMKVAQKSPQVGECVYTIPMSTEERVRVEPGRTEVSAAFFYLQPPCLLPLTSFTL